MLSTLESGLAVDVELGFKRKKGNQTPDLSSTLKNLFIFLSKTEQNIEGLLDKYAVVSHVDLLQIHRTETQT